MALTNMGFKTNLVQIEGTIERERREKEKREEEEEEEEEKKKRGEEEKPRSKVWKLTLIMELNGSMEL